MDTNLLQILVTQMANQGTKGSGDSGLSTLVIAGIILLAAVAPTLVSLAAYWQAKAAKISGEENKKSVADTAVSMEKVHIAVNSERAAMLELVNNLRLEVLKLSQEKATLTEHQHGQEVAATVLAASVSGEPTKET